MNLVNANELIAAGVNFQMQNEDAAFGDDGELLGYTEVEVRREWDSDPEAAGDHRNRWFSSSEGLTDTTELSKPYWDEVADSHLAEMQKAEWLGTPKATDAQPLHGTMEFWADVRARRFDALRRDAKRAKQKKNWERLATLKAGVKARYEASLALVNSRAKAEWHLLYLTSAQVSYLLRV